MVLRGLSLSPATGRPVTGPYASGLSHSPEDCSSLNPFSHLLPLQTLVHTIPKANMYFFFFSWRKVSLELTSAANPLFAEEDWP